VSLDVKEKQTFIDTILEKDFVVRTIQDHFARIDVEQAEAGSAADLKMIKEAVAAMPGGFVECNRVAFEQMRKFMDGVLCKLVKESVWMDVAAGELVARKAAASSLQELHVAVKVATAFGDFGEDGRRPAAVALFEFAIEEFTARGHLVHTIHVQQELARLLTLGSKSDIAEALRLHSVTVEELTSLFGARNVLTLEAKVELARALLRKGDYAEAKRILTPVVQELEAQLGHDNESTLAAQHNLAQVLVQTREFAEARRLITLVVDGHRRRGHGPHHQRMLQAQSLLRLCCNGKVSRQKTEFTRLGRSKNSNTSGGCTRWRWRGGRRSWDLAMKRLSRRSSS
jgi:hypothetical protein